MIKLAYITAKRKHLNLFLIYDISTKIRQFRKTNKLFEGYVIFDVRHITPNNLIIHKECKMKNPRKRIKVSHIMVKASAKKLAKPLDFKFCFVWM